MGYLFSLLSVVTGSIKGFCGKRTSDYTRSAKDAMLFNSVRMVFCVIIGVALSLASDGITSLIINPNDILSVVLSGVFSATLVVSWLICAKSGAYILIDVFMMLSVLVPLLGEWIFYGKAVTLKQWIGLGILIIATAILCSYNNKIKQKIKLSYLGILIFCGLSTGLSDFAQKIFVLEKSGTSISTFNLYSYLISFIVLFLCYVFTPKEKENQRKDKIPKIVFIYILIMAACLFFYSFFQTLAARYLSSAQLFPFAKSLSLILSVFMASVFFSERVNLKCIIGVALAFIGILVINL